MDTKEKKAILDIFTNKVKNMESSFFTISEIKDKGYLNNLFFYLEDPDQEESKRRHWDTRRYIYLDLFNKNILKNSSEEVTQLNGGYQLYFDKFNYEFNTHLIINILRCCDKYTIVFFSFSKISIDCKKVKSQKIIDETIFDRLEYDCRIYTKGPMFIVNDDFDELYIINKNKDNKYKIDNSPIYFKHQVKNAVLWAARFDKEYDLRNFSPIENSLVLTFPYYNGGGKIFSYLLQIYLKHESKFLLSKFESGFADRIRSDIKLTDKDMSCNNYYEISIENHPHSELAFYDTTNRNIKYAITFLNKRFYWYCNVGSSVIGIKFVLGIPNVLEINAKNFIIFPEQITEIKKNQTVNSTFFVNNFVGIRYANVCLNTNDSLNEIFSKIGIDYDIWEKYKNYYDPCNTSYFLAYDVLEEDFAKYTDYITHEHIRRIFTLFLEINASDCYSHSLYKFLYEKIINWNAGSIHEAISVSENRLNKFIDFIKENSHVIEFTNSEFENIYGLIVNEGYDINIDDYKAIDQYTKEVIVFLSSQEIHFDLKKLLSYRERVICAQGKSEESWGYCFKKYLRAAQNFSLDLTDEKYLFSNTLDMDTNILSDGVDIFEVMNQDYIYITEKRSNRFSSFTYSFEEKEYFISPCTDLYDAFSLNLKLNHNMGLIVSEAEHLEMIYFKITDKDNNLKYILKYDCKRDIIDSVCGMKNSKASKDEMKIILELFIPIRPN